MAKARDVPGPETNPDVRHERADVGYKGIIWFAVVLARAV